jgi:hypothetical protein
MVVLDRNLPVDLDGSMERALNAGLEHTCRYREAASTDARRRQIRPISTLAALTSWFTAGLNLKKSFWFGRFMSY